jgi:RNA-directed DNA polymerase
MAMEPFWEPSFEGTSYGFRPGRSTLDAIGRIFVAINQGKYYVLDADIAKCFNQIDHDYLLSKLHCPTTIRRNIRQWLKAGVIDNGVFDDTKAGTPQGGVISPLLANIALDGMVRHIGKLFPKHKVKGKTINTTVVRYADDFVVISPKLEIIEQCKIAISEWLKPAGLQLKPEKTRICHTLREIEVDGVKVPPGFDFLGFNIRQYPKGKHTSGKSGHGSLLGFKTHMKPSKKAIKAHTEKVKEVIKEHKTAPQAALIKHLNPIITGWSRYYSGVVSSEIFGKLDHILWQQLRAWVVSRCGNAKYKTLRKYFRTGKVILSNGKERNEKWIFQAKDGLRLQKHNWTPIVYHTLVRPNASTYDGNWVYWATRRGKSPEISNREAQLLKSQKGKCKWCGQHFTIEDQVETDHIIPRCLGGKDDYKNLQLLHRHCHDAKTAIDGSQSKGCTHDNETIELEAV